VETQVERTMKRDNNDEAQVRRIFAAQTSREDRLARADDILVNDRDLQHVHSEVHQLHERYLTLAESNA